MGCNKCSGNEDYETSQIATTQPCISEFNESGCLSNKGKFFDQLLEQVVVPKVGKEFYIKVCEANLWKIGMWIAANLPNNKFAVFKITETGKQKIKLLNGLDKSGDKSVYGNPEAGTEIKEGTVIYPVVPAGADSEFVTKVINALETSGVETVIKILEESDNICFSNIPLISEEDGELHFFGGTKSDCDCDYTYGAIKSCFRKLTKLLTGQGGKTICTPDVSVTSSENLDEKRVCVYDENGCLKKWKTLQDLESCSGSAEAEDNQLINSLIGCVNGVRTNIPAKVGKMIVSVPVNDEEPDGAHKWKIAKAGLQYFPIEPQVVATGPGTTNNELNDFPHKNCYGLFTVEWETNTLNSITLKVDGEFIYKFKYDDAGEVLLHASKPTKLSIKNPSIIIAVTGGPGTGITVKLIGYYAKYQLND